MPALRWCGLDSCPREAAGGVARLWAAWQREAAGRRPRGLWAAGLGRARLAHRLARREHEALLARQESEHRMVYGVLERQRVRRVDPRVVGRVALALHQMQRARRTDGFVALLQPVRRRRRDDRVGSAVVQRRWRRGERGAGGAEAVVA
eukprot:6074675-Prymnesium_polylepis.1